LAKAERDWIVEDMIRTYIFKAKDGLAVMTKQHQSEAAYRAFGDKLGVWRRGARIALGA
jgi:hypothetical protein